MKDFIFALTTALIFTASAKADISFHYPKQDPIQITADSLTPASNGGINSYWLYSSANRNVGVVIKVVRSGVQTSDYVTKWYEYYANGNLGPRIRVSDYELNEIMALINNISRCAVRLTIDRTSFRITDMKSKCDPYGSK